uniref:Uncharacterized protein n=1 Tax=viral metagenome TaxID=1070528 RepID=A0A6C0E9J5_9ZZZZ
MYNICKNYQHYLYFSYESSTGDCLSCKYIQSSNDHEFKQYLRRNVPGAKCPNSLCEVTMGRGWIGSHHGGPRMTCGDCSGNYNFHPGLSHDGYKAFNDVKSGCFNITQSDRNKLAEKIRMDEQKRREEEEQRRKDDIERKQNQIRSAMRQAEIDNARAQLRENENLIKYDNQRSEFTKFVNNLINNPDSIMAGIKETPMKGYIIHRYDGIYDGKYGIVHPAPRVKTKYVCCFKTVDKNINASSTKFVLNDIKKMCAIGLPYDKSNLHKLLIGDETNSYLGKKKLEYQKIFFKHNGHLSGEADIMLLIYDKDRYGLIEIN